MMAAFAFATQLYFESWLCVARLAFRLGMLTFQFEVGVDVVIERRFVPGFGCMAVVTLAAVIAQMDIIQRMTARAFDRNFREFRVNMTTCTGHISVLVVE